MSKADYLPKTPPKTRVTGGTPKKKKKDGISIGYVHNVDVAHSWTDSLFQMGFFDGAEHLNGIIKTRCGTGDIAGARNTVAGEVMKRPDDDWLLWIDTDMGFKPDTMQQLLAVADPEERPIVGALCFTAKETEFDEYQGYRVRARPTILDWVKTEIDGKETQCFMGRAWYPPNMLVQCKATGMACVLIHRSVFEKIHEKFGPHWYDRAADGDGQFMGEDISFCMRCGVLDIPIYVHTGIRTTHMKTFWLGEEDFWTEQPAPPATERTLVVVPVLHRPANAEPFMQSLRASTGMADVIAVADEDDILTIAAWQEQGVTVLKGSEHTFAEKANRAYRDGLNGHKWLFLTGDDVQFYPGWLDHAQWMAHNAKASVIGTNDLGNPRVVHGEHGTHLLIERAYIDEHGASWDGPKIVAHEGYGHWYVDDEIVTVAKQRGVWVAALGSIVEHMHPIWGKAQNDSTYAEGMKTQQADQELFLRRLKENT
jgi:hypothetical protein